MNMLLGTMMVKSRYIVNMAFEHADANIIQKASYAPAYFHKLLYSLKAKLKAIFMQVVAIAKYTISGIQSSSTLRRFPSNLRRNAPMNDRFISTISMNISNFVRIFSLICSPLQALNLQQSTLYHRMRGQLTKSIKFPVLNNVSQAGSFRKYCVNIKKCLCFYRVYTANFFNFCIN